MPYVRVRYQFDVDEQPTLCQKATETTYYVPRFKDVSKTFNKLVKATYSWRDSHKNLKMVEVKAFSDDWELVRTWYTGKKPSGYWEVIG